MRKKTDFWENEIDLK